MILPHSESSPCCSHASGDSAEIEPHLQLMARHLRPHDSVKMVVRLQTSVLDHVRYLSVVSSHDGTDSHIVLLGMDYYKGQMTIGVVLPLLWCSSVRLIGDGGVVVGDIQEKGDAALLFRPVSVQAMWCIFQTLHRMLSTARRLSLRRRGDPLATVCEYYTTKVTSPDFLCSQWQQSPLEIDEDYGLKADTVRENVGTESVLVVENDIRRELRQIMQTVDLDSVTSRDIRQRLAEAMGNIDSDKEFIDREMLVILGQMDKPSQIFPYLLLGTEWNASNWEELKATNVEYILNMTREVDCFFPQHFKYKKVAVSDEASTQLLNYWNSTYQFLKEAKDAGKVVLVHCKKGISRSSSTVIAFAMKEYGWSLDEALDYVKTRRNCITPNKGFMEQLRTFGGALEASRYRHLYGQERPTRSVSAVRSPPSGSSATVRLIVTAFERRRRDTSQPVDRPRFPLDIIKRSSIQQIS